MLAMSTAILQHVKAAITKLKVKLIIQNIIKSLIWALIVGFIAHRLLLSSYYVTALSALTLIIHLLIFLKSARYQKVTVENLILHLNRHYSKLEESAQLVFIKDCQLSDLQKLQKQRVMPRLHDILEKEKAALLPRVSHRNSLFKLLAVFLICSVVSIANLSFFSSVTEIQHSLNIDDNLQQKPQVTIENIEVTVVPPQYTGIKNKQYSVLDIELIEGSIVRWRFRFDDSQQDYFIKRADGTLHQLKKQADNSYLLEKQINFTGIYQIVTKKEVLANIYTLTVINDKKPRIRIVTPKKTITEIATNGVTELEAQVQISDDFGIGKVDILASIAKGSGESVKFRDQIFSFDSSEIIDGTKTYQKLWQLTSLGMEPGDELYFTIKAWDNRQPQQQMTRSATKIIRWLEDEEQGILSDGVLIDFMPEYFKSQRQIIIETIELIDDKRELSKDSYVETSELLGIAQSDLKEKYGQYLGDEVEDGGGGHAISTAASEGIEQASHDSSSDSLHDSSGSSEQHEGEAQSSEGHQHENEHVSDPFSMNSFGNDRSGLSDSIARFGHNHEDADIGIMSRQDPKSLMKRSIANMWQAELHLMLSEPEKALPFEQEALKYLKMAKKAERIYVKRLGFEPPPVTEQRRYQGDLEDILTYQSDQEIDVTSSESKSLTDLYILLNKRSALATDNAQQLTLEQRKLIQTVKTQFETLLLNRPAMIKTVAILERILLINSFNFTTCDNCKAQQDELAQLSYKIWQLLPAVRAKPSVRNEKFSDNDSLFKAYNSFLMDEAHIRNKENNVIKNVEKKLKVEQ